MATFNEMRAPTSRKYLAEQGKVIPNLPEKNKSFHSHSSIFVLEKQSKNLNFHYFLPLKEPSVAIFNQRRAPTFRKYVTEHGIRMPNSLKTLHCSRSNS